MNISISTRLDRLRQAVAGYRANTKHLDMSFAAKTAGAELDNILNDELAIKINEQNAATGCVVSPSLPSVTS